MKKEDPFMKNTSQISNDQQQDSSFELDDQSTSQAIVTEASHHRYRRDSDSNESGSESSSEEGSTDIFDAIEKGEEADVKLFLEKGVDLNEKKDGNTPLHLAIEKNRKEIALLLLEKNKDGSYKWGINISLENRKGKKPLNLVKSKVKKNPNDPNWRSIKEALLEPSRSSTSGQSQVQPSGAPKREPSSDTGPGPSSSRDSSEASPAHPGPSESSPSQRPSTATTYDSREGGKPSYRGFVYQLKLLMLFVKRAIEKKYDFRLATEMDAAEKFDDVVFKYYHEEEKKWLWRYLQIKHKENVEAKKITTTCLTSEKGEKNKNAFTLHKYFISFCKIKNNELFKPNSSNERIALKDFDICTNTDFDFKLLKDKDWNSFLSDEKDLGKDEILYLGKGEKIRQFKNDAQTIEGIIEKIKPGLIEVVLEGEKFENNKKILDNIISNVLKSSEGININSDNGNIIKAGKEVQMFLKGWLFGEEKFENLDQAIEGLKKTGKNSDDSTIKSNKAKVIEEYDKIIEEVKGISGDRISRSIPGKLEAVRKRIQEKLDTVLKLDNEDKKLKEIRKINTNDFTKDEILKNYTNEAREILSKNSSANEVIEKLKKAVSEIESEKEVLKVVLDEGDLKVEMAEFLEKFRFVVKYPGVDKLDDLIKEEFKNEGLEKELFSLNSDLIYASFEKKMSDWFKGYNKGRGEFLSAQEGAEFLKSIQKEINDLMIAGLREAYLEKLRDYGIRFKENPEGLNDFLSPEGKFKDKQILHISTPSTRLSAIKTLESLEGTEDEKKRNYFAKEDGYIFMRLRTLLRPDTQDLAIRSFSSNQTHDLLVIECQDKTQDKIDGLYKRLSEVLDKDKKKKIILMAQEGDLLARKFKDSQKGKYRKENDRTSFEDLDGDSQDKVLERKVDFQGKEISLNQLIDKDSAREIIDQASLSRLLEEERIPIGDQKAFSSSGYVKDYYIPRTLHRQRVKNEVLNLKEAKDLGSLFITRANEERLTKLGAKKEDIHIWEDGKTYDREIIWPGSEQSNQKNKEIFQKLGKKVHWLEYQDGRLVWRASKGNSLALKKYIDKNDVLDGKNILREEDFSKEEALGQKVIIIANDPGVGKSTVLTSIAQEMKRKDPALWVVRVNLNDYAEKGKENSLEKIDFQENDINAAIDFVSKMAVPGYSNDPDIKMQRKLLKAGLEKPENTDGQNPKIVILFDGFDEISPSYKPNTTKLIKALKGSNVTQLWVTTRVHEKSHLEEELESPAYILNSLTEEERKEFLNKFWRWRLKFSKDPYNQEVRENTYQEICKYLEESRQGVKKSLQWLDVLFVKEKKESIERFYNEIVGILEGSSGELESLREAVDGLDFSAYAKVLLDQWKGSIQEKSFTDVPLQIKMLAEVIFEKKFQLSENLGLFDLYEEFIKVKFDIYHQAKNKMPKGNVGADDMVKRDLENLGRVHHELALKLFFPEECKKKSLPGLEELNRFKNEELARVGLLTLKGGQLEFIHRSFAEYFLSEYLIKNLQNEQVQKLLLKEILLDYKYELIRKFFNGQLEKNPSSEDILKEAIKQSIINANSTEDTGTATQEIAEFLLDEFKKYPGTFSELVLKTYKHGNNLLYMAAIEGDSQKIKVLLNWVKENLDKETLKDLALSVDIKGRNALYWAATEGHFHKKFCDEKALEALLEGLNDHPEILEEMVLKNTLYEVTILQDIAYRRNHKHVKALLKGLNDHSKILKRMVLKPPSVLHSAVEQGHTEIVKALLKGLKEHPDILKALVLQTDKDGQTILQKAAKYSGNEIINTLLGSINDPKVLKDLAILSVYGDVRKKPKEMVNKLLDTVGHNGKIGENLKSIQDCLGEVKEKRESLDEAISDGNETQVQEILKQSKVYIKELLLATDEIGKTVLHLAVEKNHTEISKVLLKELENHPNILQTLMIKVDKDGQTILQKAAECADNKIINTLLGSINDSEALKALVLATDKDRQTALHVAAKGGHTETVQTLLEFVRDHLDKDTLKELVLHHNDYSRRTALHEAAKQGHTEIVKTLLNFVRDHLEKAHSGTIKDLVLALDDNELTALHVAVLEEHATTIETLLNWVKENLNNENPPDTTLKDLILAVHNGMQTALCNAVDSGKKEIVEALLEPLKNHPKILKEMLLEVDESDKNTALHQAANWGHSQIVDFLLDWVKMNLPSILQTLVLKPDNCGQTALDLAVKNKNDNVIDLLKAQYNEIAYSLNDTNITNFNDTELEVLKKYVESDDYNGQVNREQFLNKIDTELNSRPQFSEERSFEGLITQGPEAEIESGNPIRRRTSLEERYMEGYNIAKDFSQETGRLLEAGALEKGELPVLVDMEESLEGHWIVPLMNKEALDEAPRYFTTEQEIFSQVKDYLQEQAQSVSPYYNEDLRSLSFREEVPGEAVDGLNSSFLAQAVFNWVRHGFGPELQEGMGEDLSKILKAQFYVQVSMMGHGALSDTKSIVDNVKLLWREEAETLNGFEHSMLSSANSALGMGLGGAMVVLDALELSKLKDPGARAIVTTQLVFDSLNLSVGAGALISGIVASKATAGTALAEVAATSSASLGYLAVPLAGIGIGVTALVQAGGQGIEKAKGVCRMMAQLKKELAEGYVYDRVMQAFIPPSLAGVKKLTLSEKEISVAFAQQRYHRFRSGWHNRELISGGSQAYGSFLKSFGLKSVLEKEKPDDKASSTLVMPYIPSKDYDFSLGAAPFSYFRHDAEFAVAEELERKDPGFHFKVFFFDHIIKSYRENCKETPVELVVKEGDWNLIFPWVYNEPSEGAQERKAYIKRNAKHIQYSIHAESSVKAITLGLPPFEFPLNLSLSQEASTQVQWCFEMSHLDRDTGVNLEGEILQIGKFNIRLSKITKDQLFFRRQVDEILQSGKLTSKGVEWREVEIMGEDEDLGRLKEKLHTQISLHEGHEDYLRVETSAKDKATYYDVGKNRYIKTPLSFKEGSKEYHAKEALLLNIEEEHAYFYAPWDAYPLGAQGKEKLPLLFWGVDIDAEKILYKDTISFSSSEALSKCIEVSRAENFALSTKLYSAMGSTFIEERYESKVRQEKGIKLLWQLTKGETPGDLDLYLHAIEGVLKEISMERFDHLADQVMLKDNQGKVKWWLKKEKQFVDALPASSEGAYPVPLKMGKNTQGEGVSFWLLHQKSNLFDLIYQVGAQEKKRFKDIKFVSQVDERLILEHQKGIIYEVDNDFKRVVIGLDEGFLRKKKPSELQGFLQKKKNYAPVLSLRGLRDALSKPLMCWYEVRADRYYMSLYEGHPNLSYKGSSEEGLGLIYDEGQKALYTLEGIRGEDLDGHYKVSPQGAVVMDRVSKQDKLATGVGSALSDGKFLQIEDSEGCLWVCDIKRSYKEWQLRGLNAEALKGEISSDPIREKIQKAQDNFSNGGALKLEIPTFVSLEAQGYYAVGSQKLLLIHLEGKEVKEAQVLGVDHTYGYLNLEGKLYQIPLKDHWSPGQAWPECIVLGAGKIQRVGASLILLEGSLSEEAIEHLRELKGIKDFYINSARMKDQVFWLYSGMASEFKERAPMILSLLDVLPEGIVRIHLDEKAGEVYKVFGEGEDLVIGYGSEKRELILKEASKASSRNKVGFYLPGKGSALTLGAMVEAIDELIDSGACHEGERIKLKEVLGAMRV